MYRELGRNFREFNYAVDKMSNLSNDTLVEIAICSAPISYDQQHDCYNAVNMYDIPLKGYAKRNASLKLKIAFHMQSIKNHPETRRSNATEHAPTQLCEYLDRYHSDLIAEIQSVRCTSVLK